MKRILIYIFIWLISLPVLAQNEIVNKYAATISQDDLRGLLTIIASDALEGRETGTRGQKMAAAFIEEEFKRIGLLPVVPTEDGLSYLQKFRLEDYDPDGIYLKTENTRFNLKDNILFSGRRAMSSPNTRTMIFSSQDEITEGLDLKNKVALIIAIGSNEKQHATLTRKAYKNGASMVIIIPFAADNEFKKYRKSESRNYARTKLAFEQKGGKGTNGYFLVAPQVAANILRVEKSTLTNMLSEGVSRSFINKINSKELNVTYFTSLPIKHIDTENVLGYLEGTDKKDELVVITAHYDHIGRRGEQINNGADDDGSGTSAVIEVAEAYALAKAAGHGPRRSILFMTVTGEEKGLLGSKYYVENPIIPLQKVVYCFNSDNGGYNDTSKATIIGLNRTTAAHHMVEAAQQFGLTAIDDPAPEQGLFDRSDNVHFAAKGIPAPAYSMGFTSFNEEIIKYYHQVTDNPETLDYDYLLKFFRSYVLSSRMIANDPEVPFWVEGDKYYKAGEKLYGLK